MKKLQWHFFIQISNCGRGEKIFEFFNSSNDESYEFDAFFPGTHGFSQKVVVDGEFCGAVIAYPYFKDTSTSEELEKVVHKMIECGISQDDARFAITKVKKFSGRFYTEMKELVGIVADEVATPMSRGSTAFCAAMVSVCIS